MIWISSMVMVQIFIMDVRRLYLESFGILVVVVEAQQIILTYVRYLTYWFEETEKNYQFKMSKIVGCKMVRQERDLDFDFYKGACQTFTDPEPVVLLCFDYNENRSCRT